MPGLRPYKLVPLNRGCVEKIVVCFRKNGQWIDKTEKTLYLTCKTQPWDDVADDSDAIFKKTGTIPDSTNEPGRIVFTLTEEDTYLDPETTYYVDVVETDNDGTSNAQRDFIGYFNVIGGANNAQAGGE